MAIILGLDVSTTVIGVCVVDSNIVPDNGQHIIVLDRIEFKSCKTIWEKADHVDHCLRRIRDEDKELEVDRVVLEEPLMGFRPGMSSAQTISTLMRFNGVISYMARNVFQREPEYIGAGHARALCGIKLQRTALDGPQKEQVFRHMMANDLSFKKWPLKKNGKSEVDWSRDACDAYVIARAASINGPIQPPVKKPKKPKLVPVQTI